MLAHQVQRVTLSEIDVSLIDYQQPPPQTLGQPRQVCGGHVGAAWSIGIAHDREIRLLARERVERNREALAQRLGDYAGVLNRSEGVVEGISGQRVGDAITGVKSRAENHREEFIGA